MLLISQLVIDPKSAAALEGAAALEVTSVGRSGPGINRGGGPGISRRAWP